MTQFACESVAAVNHLSVNHDTRTYACTECNVDEVFHASCYTVCHLAERSSVGIIGHTYRQAAEGFAEQVGQWYHSVVCPRKIWSEFNGSIIIVCVWRTDTHCLNLVNAAYRINDRLESFYGCLHIVFNFFVTACLDGSCCFDLSASIYDAEN